MPDLAQKILRRALENGARHLEDEARRQKHYGMGGAESVEGQAKIIRENIEALCAVKVGKP